MNSRDEAVTIEISDNGKGFPEDLLDRITEPYVTTREKGTGLGLAIAKKIMEDHNGELLLRNNNTGVGYSGANVTLVFKVADALLPAPQDEQVKPSSTPANEATKISVPAMTASESN